MGLASGIRVPDFSKSTIYQDWELYIFINKYAKNKLPSILTNWFTFSSISHNNQTLVASKGNLQIPSVQTTSYGKNAFVYIWMLFWKKWMLNTSLVNSSTRKIFPYLPQTQATFNECLFYISICLLSFSSNEPQ